MRYEDIWRSWFYFELSLVVALEAVVVWAGRIKTKSQIHLDLEAE